MVEALGSGTGRGRESIARRIADWVSILKVASRIYRGVAWMSFTSDIIIGITATVSNTAASGMVKLWIDG